MYFTKGIFLSEARFTVASFSRTSIVTGSFMFQKTVSMTFLTGYTFYLPESQYVSTPWTVFSTQVRTGKPMFSPFVKKNATPYTSYILLKMLHTLNFSASKYLIRDHCSIQEHPDFPLFGIALK